MKKLSLTILLALCTLGVWAQSESELRVYTLDKAGKYTNVRNAPNGKVVDRIPTADAAMFAVASPTKGWWKIVSEGYGTGDYEGTFKGSTTGYWIHYSVLAVDTRNYGGQTLCLRQTPNTKGAVVYKFSEEIDLRPMDISADGEWVKVKTFDGKHTGWIEANGSAAMP